MLSGNVVEAHRPPASSSAGGYMREVVATSNLVRACRVGILVTPTRAPAPACCRTTWSPAPPTAPSAPWTRRQSTGPELAHGAATTTLSIAGNLSV